MRRSVVLMVMWAVFAAGAAVGEQPKPPREDTFYKKSLHYTNRGIEFIYSKEQGGLERLTGVSAEKMGCLQAKCHVRGCDECHAAEREGKWEYSVARAKTEAACTRCHPVPEDTPDVHFKMGMKCMDCHSGREIHGDGVVYDTYLQPGFFDTRCEDCHTNIPLTSVHAIHGGKLDCRVCHASQITTCFNCHIDTRLATGKDSQIPVEGLFFLVNHDNKVKLGNVISYVYGNKTMITVAPAFPHTIVKKGRSCPECHATDLVRGVKKGSLELFAWRDGKPVTPEGVVPIIEGMKWNLTYLGKDGDVWVPLTDASRPLVNFSGYCSPLTADQLKKLEKRQPAR
jgi:hypothetical protein